MEKRQPERREPFFEWDITPVDIISVVFLGLYLLLYVYFQGV